MDDLTARLKAEALRLGFNRVGIAPAVSPPGYPNFLRWLDEGREAGMGYLRRNGPAREHPDSILEGVRSVVMVSVVYGSKRPVGEIGPRSGKVARYAWSDDYHRVLWDKLGALLDWLRAEHPEARGRVVVDTAPLLERDFARLAGLGWIGKNTMLIDRHLGSFTFLGALLTDLELVTDRPHETSHCGTCTRCLDACPTGAFDGPNRLDARRCISYWTIEHRGPIPDFEAGQLDGWVFGCDVCQDVCPWNRKAPGGRMPELEPRSEWLEPDLFGWLDEDQETWRARLKGSAASRARRAGLLRNAALVLGARGGVEAVAALARRLDDREEDATVRAAAAWALGRIPGDEAREAIARHRDDEDPVVREAVREAAARSTEDPGGSG